MGEKIWRVGVLYGIGLRGRHDGAHPPQAGHDRARMACQCSTVPQPSLCQTPVKPREKVFTGFLRVRVGPRVYKVVSSVMLKGTVMDFVIAGFLAVFVLGYLIYALMRPEKF